jgi:hypothetical protein
MKKTLLVLAILTISAMPVAAGQGNGAPTGAHYNLNIIGVQNAKTADMDNSNGHTIFVSLEGKTKIGLTEGDFFAVLDRNGTDQDGASFQLPNPDPDNDGVTQYSVFARALGKPLNSATMTTCAYDETGELECSMAVLTLERTKGRQKFDNVSRYLLYIYADIDEDGVIERVPLFGDSLEGYFWDYDNNGLKIAQLRFYEIETTVPDTYPFPE